MSTHVECIEEIIIKTLESKLKKIKVKLNNTEIKILSDNHEYILTSLNFANLIYETKNTLNYFYDKNKIKLLKSISEIKIQDLKITANKNDVLILDLNSFNFNMHEEILYYHQSREANIRTTLNTEIPNIDIIISTRELDKIIEIIVCICSNLEKLDTNSTHVVNKYIEHYNSNSLLNIHFEDVNLIVHDDVMQSEFSNISLNVHIESQKFIGEKIDISFSPITVGIFAKNNTKYSSNILLKGFKLDIIDDFRSSKIDIVFDDVKIVVYDNHLIDALKFIADFLNYELKGNAETIHKKNTQTLKKKIKKEQCHLLFKNVTLYYYVDFVDLFTIKVKDYSFNIDDNMLIPRLKIYHQSTNKLFLMKRTKALSLHKFYIKFEPELNEIYIEFGNIHFNFYCFELAHPIVKMFIYHHFFPNWIIYHMHYKHKIDEENKQIYIDDFAKKDRCFIKFESIYLTVNQHDISSASVFQTNPEIMARKVDVDNPKRVIEYLKGIKSNQIAIKVTNFTIKTQGFCEKETTKEEKRQSNIVYQFEDSYGDYIPIMKENEYFRKSTRSNIINFRRRARDEF